MTAGMTDASAASDLKPRNASTCLPAVTWSTPPTSHRPPRACKPSAKILLACFCLDFTPSTILLQPRRRRKLPRHRALHQPSPCRYVGSPPPNIDAAIPRVVSVLAPRNGGRSPIQHGIHFVAEKHPLTAQQQSHKSFRTKKKLAKAQKQNRPIPQWIRLRTGNKIRYDLTAIDRVSDLVDHLEKWQPGRAAPRADRKQQIQCQEETLAQDSPWYLNTTQLLPIPESIAAISPDRNCGGGVDALYGGAGQRWIRCAEDGISGLIGDRE